MQGTDISTSYCTNLLWDGRRRADKMSEKQYFFLGFAQRDSGNVQWEFIYAIVAPSQCTADASSTNSNRPTSPLTTKQLKRMMSSNSRYLN